MIQLRNYQTQLIEDTRALMRSGVRSILIQSPTGSGKTALTAAMLKAASDKGSLAWFVVHRRELVEQSELAFRAAGVKHAVVAAGFPGDRRAPVQICSVQTLIGRMKDLQKPDLIVFDESHHCRAKTWEDIKRANPQAYYIGLTATPCRLDGKGLGTHFDHMLLGPTVNDLIARKYLADYDLFAPQLADASKLKTRAGDFAQDDIAKLMDQPTITGDAIAHYQRLAPGKRAIVFCASVKHSMSIAQAFRDAGVAAAHIDGKTPTDERRRLMKAFRDGRLLVLSNVELFGEGVDVPAIEAAILLRPTKSLGLYLQQIGRALRPAEGKARAIIIDHVGAAHYHGLPDDEHEWTLEGVDRSKKAKEKAPSVKLCPACFRAMRPQMRACVCGHVFEVKEREIGMAEGELVAVDKEALRRKRRQEQGMTDSFADLVALGESRGYGKKAVVWARIVTAARDAKKTKKAQNA